MVELESFPSKERSAAESVRNILNASSADSLAIENARPRTGRSSRLRHTLWPGNGKQK
jgi:hypothetical protein